MKNYSAGRQAFGGLASLAAIAAIWTMIGAGVNGWHWNNNAPAATRSGELVTPLDGNQCRMPVWVSAASGGGGHITVLLDSGDNDELSLTRADAATAGIDVGSLWFIFPYHSSSGMGWMAHAKLRELRIGGAELRNVSASVISETTGNGVSLVGLPLLTRLNFSLRGDSCVVSW